MDILPIIDLADDILFILLLAEVVYLLFLGSVTKSIVLPCSVAQHHRFAILVPEGQTFPMQDYERNLYEVFGYNDWRETLQTLDASLYDEAIILGPFTSLSEDLLTTIDRANNGGYKVVQLHTVLHDNSTYALRRRARKEELRNGFLKSGRCGRGLSSAMDKLYFALPLQWAQEHIKSQRTNIEWLATSHKLFIKYIEEPFVYVDSFPDHFRARPFAKAMRRLAHYLFRGDREEIDRGLARLFPSFKALVYILFVLALATSFFSPGWSVKWWFLIYLTFFAYSLAMPDYVMAPHRPRKIKSLYRLWKSRQ
jgi:hypothetical protein